jgi:hypothetical protein
MDSRLVIRPKAGGPIISWQAIDDRIAGLPSSAMPSERGTSLKPTSAGFLAPALLRAGNSQPVPDGSQDQSQIYPDTLLRAR